MASAIVFHYENYRKYLNDFIADRPRGTRSDLAKCLNCQPGYVTQVLKGEKDLSLEQGLAFAQFAGLKGGEKDFFITLLQKDRAGTSALRAYCNEQLEQLRARSAAVLQERLPLPKRIEGRDLVEYYSAWYYAAIHVCLSISSLREPSALAKELKLPLSSVVRALQYLERVGFAEHVDGEYHLTQNSIHLGGDDPLVSKHHANWRVRTLQALEQGSLSNANSVHFSSVITLSREDARKIQGKLIEWIREAQAISHPSPEEVTRVLCVDFYPLGE